VQIVDYIFSLQKVLKGILMEKATKEVDQWWWIVRDLIQHNEHSKMFEKDVKVEKIN